MREPRRDDAASRGASAVPWAVRLYEALLVVPLLVWLSVGFMRDPSVVADPLLLAWVVAIAIVDLLPVPTSVGIPFSLSFPLQLSVALLYPPPVAGAIALLGSTDKREFTGGVRLGMALWNRAQIALSVVVEGWIFHHLASLDSHWSELVPAVLLAGAVGYGVNAGSVALYMHLKDGVPFLRLLRDMHVGILGEFVLSYLGLALFSVVVATTFVKIGPWSIAVFIAPIAFARQMFTRTHSLQEATVELEAKTRENEWQALHDHLTGLPNRVLFMQHLRDAIARADPGRLVAVMIMDLDRFKEINDTLGHHFGDRLLQEIGPRLAHVLRDGDLMARLGGDEFGVVLPDLPDEAVAVRIAERLLEELERPLTVEGLALDVTGSIGIAIHPAHSDDVEALLRCADVAMYAAKDAGGGVEVYHPGLDQYSPRRLALVSRVRSAIENGEFVLHYQPKVRLADGRGIGVEALVRWRHPELGLIQPDGFIPLVEQTVQLRPLTYHVLERSIQQWHAWARRGLQVGLAVNVSARSLLDTELPGLVAQLLDRWSMPPQALTLELTESFLMADSARSIGVMAELSNVGVRLSIDDFGTGYSSLGYLKRLPIDEIKVDRSFVTNMQKDPNDAMIVRATVELGRNLGLEVVAEGVEDDETLRELTDLGCDLAQGFLIGPPLPPAEATRWLELHARASRIPARSRLHAV